MGKITIVGAGNAGCTYAAYAGMAGHDVCLYESPEFADNLTDIAARGGLEITGRVAKTTTDIKEALEYADYILVVMPAFGHKIMAKLFAPYLKSGQTVVLNPGDVFGAVEFLSTLRQCGNHEDVTIGEHWRNCLQHIRLPQAQAGRRRHTWHKRRDAARLYSGKQDGEGRRRPQGVLPSVYRCAKRSAFQLLGYKCVCASDLRSAQFGPHREYEGLLGRDD